MSALRLAGSMLAGVASMAALSPAPASAAPYPWEGPTVTKVKLNKGGDWATVHFTARCPKGDNFSIAVVDVFQDSTPMEAPADALYSSPEILNISCTGREQRVAVKVFPDTTGAYAPADGRLHKGPGDVTLGGEFEYLPLVEVEDVRIK